MRTQDMLSTHPRRSSVDSQQLAACIAALVECADTCNICADACLGEEKVQMLAKCIRQNLDCADVCRTTAGIISRQTFADPQFMKQSLVLCATACQICGQECEQHAEMHQHCRICASACHSCEEACHQLISTL